MAPIITPPQEFYEKADLKAAAFLILNLTLLLGSGIIAWHLHVWWAYGVAALLVGGCGQACFILLHEAMHQSLLTNRTGNDIVALVLASLLGVRFYLGREAHILHHREIGTDADPSSFWYNLNDRRPGWSTVRFLLAQLVGARLVKILPSRWAACRALLGLGPSVDNSPVSGETRSASAAEPALGLRSQLDLICPFLLQAVLFLAVSVLSSALVYMFLFCLPLMTLTGFLNGIMSFTDHFLPGRHPTSEAEKNRCFYMKAGRLERLLISPFGFHFHHIHHIYPQVCVFQTKKLHTWLETYDPDYRHRYVIREGYMRTALQYVLNRPISGAGRFYPLMTR